MLPLPLQFMVQEAQRRQGQLGDVTGTQPMDYSAGLPQPFGSTPVVLPQQLGGASAGLPIQKLLSDPSRMATMGQGLATRADNEYANALGEKPKPLMNKEAGLLTVGLATLAAALGARGDMVQNAVGNLVGGLQQNQQQSEARRLNKAQMLHKKQMGMAQNLQNRAESDAQRLAKIEAIKRDAQERAAAQVRMATNARTIPEAVAALKEAKRLGGDVSKEFAGEVLSRAGAVESDLKAERDRQKLVDESNLLLKQQDKFRLNEYKPFVEPIGKLASPPTGATYDRMKADYDRLRAKGASLGIENLPDFETLIAQRLDQMREGRMLTDSTHRSWMAVLNYNQRGDRWGKEQAIKLERLELEKERARNSRDGLRGQLTGGTQDAAVIKAMAQDYDKEFNASMNRVGELTISVNKFGNTDEKTAYALNERRMHQEHAVELYYAAIKELGPDHATVRKMKALLDRRKILVEDPRKHIERINAPAPFGVGPTLGGASPAQPGIYFRGK